MSLEFLISLSGMLLVIPLYFLSLEHLTLQKKYGQDKGTRIAEISGLISGWGFFAFWIGIWVSPQPRFTIPLLPHLPIEVPIAALTIPLFLTLLITTQARHRVRKWMRKPAV